MENPLDPYSTNQVPNDDDSNSTTSTLPQSDDELHPNSLLTSRTDPLTQSIDDLEDRLVTTLDSFKSHPGTRTGAASTGANTTIHSELSELLAPALETTAHTAPLAARRHAVYRADGVDDAVEEVYERLISG
eukprot:CAMPEP_0172507778 /NCGR_PEP_ID=MMETSP1066-20121228/206458_1 /TAXON_ID=671091 /ORGANISM="Coscinodiscus wailesii, Strain CCMP2513" /LENGTH=131 /DNA_ID=CAMNT_0013285457 /DNA_START=17 /DNA_END=408 /DNA_ORIENTATION=+